MVDPRFSAHRTQTFLTDLPAADRHRFGGLCGTRERMLLFLDGAGHTRVRRALVDAMRVATSEASAGRIAALAEELLGVVRDWHRIEVVAAFARPLPLLVLVDLLGAPREDAPLIERCGAAFNAAIATPARASTGAEAERAIKDLSQYLATESRFASNGVVSRLRSHVRHGTIDAPELVATVLALLSAGHGTAADLIANGLHALASHPGELAWLRASDCAGYAMNELLRFESPVQLTRREAREPVDIYGQRIQTGDRVIPVFGAANRDPMVFAKPAELWLGRPNAHMQLGFGTGAHRCPGAALARLEATIALSAFLRSFAEIVVAEPPLWRAGGTLRGLMRLTLDVSSAQR